MTRRDIHQRRAYAQRRMSKAVDRGILADTAAEKKRAANWVMLWARNGKAIPNDCPYFMEPGDEVLPLGSPTFVTRHTLRDLIGRTDLGAGAKINGNPASSA